MTDSFISTDIKISESEPVLAQINQALKHRAKILGRVRAYQTRGITGRGINSTAFIQPPYDFMEIGRATDVEPYILQSIRKHRKQVLKEGYELSGDDQKMVDYVTNRLHEIAIMSGIPTMQWLRELVSTVIQYHNGFLIFRRDATRSTGGPVRMYGKKIAPIAGIFVGDPCSMEVQIDRFGSPVLWRQRIFNSGGEADTREFDVEDVLHIPVDRKPGYTWGTPYLIPVLDDVRSLRKIEELTLMVIEKEAFPLYHYKVGTENKPAMLYENGSNEIDDVLSQVTNFPSQGFIVSSERHEVTLISRDKASMDIHPVLEYFEKRVFAGLSLSEVDLGRGNTANRGTATSMSKNLEDSALDYQQIISAFLTQFLVSALLQEGGFDVTPENTVRFEFGAINADDERAHQTHGLQMMMGNGITTSEFRKHYLNRKPMSDEDQADTLMHKQTEADIKLAKNTPRGPTAGSSTTRSTSNSVAVSVRPRNQYGIKPAKSRTNKKNDYSLLVDTHVDALKADLANASQDQVSAILEKTIDSLTAASIPFVIEHAEAGFDRAEGQHRQITNNEDFDFEPIGKRTLDRFVSNFITKSFWKVINPYKSIITDNLKPDQDSNNRGFMVIKTVEAIKASLSRLSVDQLVTAERFGFIKFARRAGYKTVSLMPLEDGEPGEQIDISNVIYKDFIPNDQNITHVLRLPTEQEPTSEEL